ncbi:hypothetical protein N7468_006196 [Penicillium chermesinum]|uniref:Uncharacterized protein n=1 Tax=Penicillium chermesinum TaxID=63820 RepID=A0A9W9NRS1_9EURO|nr:uncharacterized protein N7468_006196 [Penicillium chermesinum]KAJ5224971.1 hypothetical protein N7468_006196 [Penicillium chermesinum]KAJ6151698.1 hypothetical protein N7470_006826 [Penicillium chermesinum]
MTQTSRSTTVNQAKLDAAQRRYCEEANKRFRAQHNAKFIQLIVTKETCLSALAAGLICG